MRLSAYGWERLSRWGALPRIPGFMSAAGGVIPCLLDVLGPPGLR